MFVRNTHLNFFHKLGNYFAPMNETCSCFSFGLIVQHKEVMFKYSQLQQFINKQERVSFIGVKLRAKEPNLMKEHAKYHIQTDWHKCRKE